MTKKQPTPSNIFYTHTGLRITPEKIELTLTTDKALKKQTILPLPEGTIHQGMVSNTKNLINTLSQIINQSSLENLLITLGIPEHSNFITTLTIDRVIDEDTTNQIINQTESQLPLTPDELYIEWQWLNETTNLLQMAAVPKKVIDPYIDVVKQLNLNPLAVETTSLTLRRVIAKPETPTLLIDADNTTTLVIVEPEQAINLSAIHSTETPNQLSQSLTTTISDMLNYYKKKYKQEVSQIFYTGSFQDQLPAILPKNITSAQLSLPEQIPVQQQLGFTLAKMPIAAPSDVHSINLIPPHLQQNYNEAATDQLKKVLLTISSFFLILLNLLSGFILIRILDKQNQILKQTDSFITADNFSNRIMILNQQSNTIIDIIKQKNIFSETVNEIINNTPNNIEINHIEFDGQTHTIRIRGYAETQEKVLAYKNQLNESENFKNVTLPFSNLAQRTNLDFTIELKWIIPE